MQKRCGRHPCFRITWLLATLAATLVPCEAQRYSFRIFSETQGLTDLGTTTLLQDRAGFIWVGTNNGLFRFDGQRFRRFGAADGLPAHGISALLETSDGSLWVATEAGLSRRAGDRFIAVASNGAPPERGPETIAEDKAHGGVYLATSRGLLRIPASGRNQWVPGTEGKIVWSVFTDRRGKTWFTRTSGVCAISSPDRCYGAEADVPADSWGGLAVDFAGTVWARSARRLIAMEPGEVRFERRDRGLPYASNIGALSLDSHGNLLVPTGVGLAVRASDRRNGPEWVVIGAEAGLVVPTIPWAMADREGLIWIGMRGGGVACWLGPGEWQNWTTRQGLKSDEIWAVTRDRKGRLLAGTTWGVSTLDHGKFRTVIQIKRQLSRDRVSSIVVNDDDSLWLGTAPSGLFRYDPVSKELRHFDERDGIAAETVYSLAGRADGSIWAGSLRGIYRGVREQGRWVFHKETVGAAHEGEYFIQILLDRSGRLWAAGSEGLAVWQAGVWTRIRSDNRPVGRLGGRLAEAPDGAIWFAGRDTSGLERITMNGKGWNVEKAPEAGEFGPQVTYFLGFDRQGSLWRGTGSGVSVLARGHWVHYSRSDGLIWDDTNANAFFADADDSVWLGTTGGLSHHLRAAASIPVNAAAQIVQVHAGERTADRPAQFRLRYGEGAITIDYAALTFRRPRDVRFRYRMNGIDAGWTQTSEWEASYATLPPGHYTFEVESGTWDNGWFGQPATMSLAVTGPWWRSRWFATGATVLGMALIFLFWRYREREHRGLERQLAVAVKQRTDELQVERTRERDSNAILEMIVGNRSSGEVLDAIGNLICTHTGADIFCVLERRGDSQTVVSARGLPPSWNAALSNPGAIPFEAWRIPLVSGPATDPVWRPLLAALGEPAPWFIAARVIGNPASSLGLILIFHTNARPAPATEFLEAPVRLARIAMEHATIYDNLHRQARHDPLTGLPNRLRLEECLELAIRRCDAEKRKLALFYIDLDGFKEVNDTLSHRAGDLYLREIGERMKRSVRADDIVGRIGGDEFNVILPLLEGGRSAEEIAARVLDEIRRPVTIDGVEVSTTASLGIAIYPDDAAEGDELRRKADAAMYSAKGAGKNRFEICDNHASHSGWRGIEYEIRSALAENRLRVDYQPKVTPAGRIVSLEALVRLEHPLRGEIGPAEFIPVAERTGLILPVGAWVLNEVCRQIADWSQRGIPVVPVAVNISSAQLCRDDFARFVEETLESHRVDAAALEFEVTETLPVGKSDVAGRQVQTLRRFGVRFAIDDFGVGHSSFHWLREHSVDAIKLDRSLVQSIGTDGSIRKLVEAMIGVAGRMGIEVVAAGVETEEQKLLLVEAGCELMQGYLFARPQPARITESLLTGGGERQRTLQQLNGAVELAETA